VKVPPIVKHIICRSLSGKHLQQLDAIAVHISISWHLAFDTILCNSYT
jgi:hypothetical protein